MKRRFVKKDKSFIYTLLGFVSVFALILGVNLYPSFKFAGAKKPSKPTPTPYIIEGSYRFLAPSTNPFEVTCKVDDSSEYCVYEPFIVSNITGEPLYETGVVVTSGTNLMEFQGFDGQWTTGPSYTSQVYYPDQGSNMLFRVKNPRTPGNYFATLTIDGKTCNQPGIDCGYYGGSNLEVHMTITDQLPSNCTCEGIGKCKKYTNQLDCNNDSKCTWTCNISQPSIIIPNGGEVWTRGNTYKITWEQYQTADSTGLFLYTRGEQEDQYIGAIAYHVSNLKGINSYNWTIPQIGSQLTNPPQDGSNIIISVAQYDSSGKRITEDKSDATFTITSY